MALHCERTNEQTTWWWWRFERASVRLEAAAKLLTHHLFASFSGSNSVPFLRKFSHSNVPCFKISHFCTVLIAHTLYDSLHTQYTHPQYEYYCTTTTTMPPPPQQTLGGRTAGQRVHFGAVSSGRPPDCLRQRPHGRADGRRRDFHVGPRRRRPVGPRRHGLEVRAAPLPEPVGRLRRGGRHVRVVPHGGRHVLGGSVVRTYMHCVSTVLLPIFE